jgi:hypothetical protein
LIEAFGYVVPSASFVSGIGWAEGEAESAPHGDGRSLVLRTPRPDLTYSLVPGNALRLGHKPSGDALAPDLLAHTNEINEGLAGPGEGHRQVTPHNRDVAEEPSAAMGDY